MVMRRAIHLALLMVFLCAVPAFGVAQSAAATDDAALQTTLNDLGSHVVAVRQQAAKRLGEMADRRATSALLRVLSDGEPRVRREAAKALGAIKDPRSVAGLIVALKDADRNVRFYAAYALGETQNPQATQPLLKAMEDTDWSVRDQAAWALREIGGEQLAERLVNLLSRPQLDAKQLSWILRHLDRPTVLTQLSTALKVDSESTRERVIIALGTLQDPQAVPVLLASLDDASPRNRWRAVTLLDYLHDARALEPLLTLARRDADESVRKAAQAAVASLSRNSDLMAYWSFDQIKDSVAQDLTGNGNDGQVKGCTTCPGEVGRRCSSVPVVSSNWDAPRRSPSETFPLP